MVFAFVKCLKVDNSMRNREFFYVKFCFTEAKTISREFPGIPGMSLKIPGNEFSEIPGNLRPLPRRKLEVRKIQG